MKLAHWHRAQGDAVTLTRRIYPDIFEPHYDIVYASAIFQFSAGRLGRFHEQWPGAIIGGTGTLSGLTVEGIIGTSYEQYDYSDYPAYEPSLGFTQRGCRLKCKFCVVPAKEGKPKSVNAIADIWRGEPHPRKLHLLDNDFFGQPEDQWRARLDEVRRGGFKICLNQGINVRLITEEAAEALASVEYRDDQFQQRRIYTAWDNLKDEKVFARGICWLVAAGIKPDHIMAYMLVGFDPAETWERLLYRFDKMVEMGIRPYPMVYDRSRKDLLAFQRWAVTGLYRAVAWADYQHSASREALQRNDGGMFAVQ
jgi:hypothetical protein